jgi:tRNA U34 2-thiouridine synthase MnmA/TrmU
MQSFTAAFYSHLWNKVDFAVDQPEPLQSPGQSLVLYHDNEILGGGIILCAKRRVDTPFEAML